MVKVFRSYHGDWFAYEPFTNRILTLDESNVKDIADVGAKDGQTADLIAQQLADSRAVDNRAFEAVAWEKSFDDYLSDMSARTPRLLLEVTRSCNLNCVYCVYSGSFSNMRPRSNESMTEETLRLSMDFFALRNKESDCVSIGFYGGEPLLRFDAIKTGVAYAKEIFRGKAMEFSVSTNGFLINRRLLEWMETVPEAYLVITLNGPFHDEYRKTSEGAGSAVTILNHLERIQKEHPAIWRNQILFQANIASVEQLPALLSFYREHIGRAPDSVTTISTQFANRTLRKLISKASGESEKTREILAEYLDSQDSWLGVFFDRGVKDICQRGLRHIRAPKVRSCFPLCDKIYVYANGDLGICESVCNRLTLGNVRTGVNKELLRQLYYKTIELFETQCLLCWNRRFCPICFRDIVTSDGTIAKAIPPEYCERFRKATLKNLKLYCDKTHNGTWPPNSAHG